MHNLDRRLTVVQQIQTGTTPLGTPIIEDVPTTIWTAKNDVSDGERFAAGQVGSHVMTRFVVRWNDFTRSIRPVDDLLFERRSYNILGIKETQDGRRRFLEITANADLDAPLVEDAS